MTKQDGKMEGTRKDAVIEETKKADGKERKGNNILCAPPFSQMRGNTILSFSLLLLLALLCSLIQIVNTSRNMTYEYNLGQLSYISIALDETDKHSASKHTTR